MIYYLLAGVAAFSGLFYVSDWQRSSLCSVLLFAALSFLADVVSGVFCT